MLNDLSVVLETKNILFFILDENKYHSKNHKLTYNEI